MGEFSEHQPKPGQKVAVCEHLTPYRGNDLVDANGVAWFEVLSGGQNLVLVNKATGEASALGHVDWLACCMTCLLEADGYCGKVIYTGTVTWRDSQPIVREGS